MSFKRIGYDQHFVVQDGATSQELPYDYSSIMHFRHNAFSRPMCQKSTVLPSNQCIPKKKLGSSYTGTELDFLHINLLYCGGMFAKDCMFHISHFLSLHEGGHLLYIIELCQ